MCLANKTLNAHFSQNMSLVKEKYEYVNEDLINDELKCIICTQAFQSPVTITCKHSFCFSCIDTWIKQNASCPICRHPLDMQSQFNKLTSEILLTQLDSLVVRCLKCNKTNIKRIDIEKHLKRCSKKSNPFGKPWRSIKTVFRTKSHPPPRPIITSSYPSPIQRYPQQRQQQFRNSYARLPRHDIEIVTTAATESFQSYLFSQMSAFINAATLTILICLIIFLVLFSVALASSVLIIIFLIYFMSKLFREH